MVIDDFMVFVSKVWYRLYWAVLTLFNASVVGGWVLVHFFPAFGDFGTTFNLDNYTSLILSGFCLVYLSSYWFVRRLGQSLATLLAAMTSALALLNGINQTSGVGAAPYIALWILTTWLNGIFGLPILLGSTLVTVIFVLVQSHFQIAAISTNSWVLLIGVLAAALTSYPYWRKRFLSTQEQEVNQLSGMLKTNQQQSEILIQSIADSVIVVSTEGKISLMNPAAALMTGWPVAEAMNVDAQLVVKLAQENGAELAPDDNPFAQILSRKESVTQILQITNRANDKQVISLVVSPIILPGTTDILGAVAVMRDVSAARAAEQQRAEFISTASHEMRTPVAAIEGYLALALNDKVSTIDSRGRSYLEKAHASTQHLGKLFQDLLTSSKAEDGRLSSHPVVVEMGAFMQQLTDDLKFAAEKKGLFAEFVIGGAEETVDATMKDASQSHMIKPLYYVRVDPDRFREVITNLFDNAVKYTPDGKITIGLTGDPDVVQLYIRDTGSGIPATDIPHLFQKFYRVDNSATRTVGGTGLGLFISRKIVELYHGRVWVESELGKGSTFFINLPRLTTQKATELQANEAATAGAIPAVTPRQS